ncbi:MAG: T9SS type A sorting domain-containing protein [Bacteroidales bacterium]|nr:T9SS type A sorting domain-containing protein [Bacteroidales bacterium]
MKILNQFLKNLAFTLFFMCISSITFPQSQVVFTSLTNDTLQKFWRVNVDSPFVFDNISQRLDQIAPLQGADYGPITVSADGNWYAFASERFDVDAQGWAALTITNSDFTSYEVIRDSTAQVIHHEGLAHVLAGGNAIVFVSDFGNHSRDIFVIHKNGNNWGMPVNLTYTSSYNYNYCPYISSDGSKILFDAGNSSFPSTAIGQVNINGTGLGFPITASSLPNGIAVHSPCYNINEDIIFEGDAAGEKIWWLPNGSLTTFIINPSYSNDNSPVTLPDGRIASLWLPDNWHQIKIMNADGTNGYLLTDSSALFTEVFDIGISTGPAYPVNINETLNQYLWDVFPNPTEGILNLTFENVLSLNSKFTMCNILGELVFESDIKTNNMHEKKSTVLDISKFPKGTYFIVLFDGKTTTTKKIIKL